MAVKQAGAPGKREGGTRCCCLLVVGGRLATHKNHQAVCSLCSIKLQLSFLLLVGEQTIPCTTSICSAYCSPNPGCASDEPPWGTRVRPVLLRRGLHGSYTSSYALPKAPVLGETTSCVVWFGTKP